MQVNEREQLDTTPQNFLSSSIVPPKPKASQKDEIAVQLSFSFACSNAFKLLIAFGLILAVGWNVYIYTSERSKSVQPSVQPANSAPGNSPSRN